MVYKKSHLSFGVVTPTVEKSEGIRPAQLYVPAPYLPLVRFDQRLADWKVISTGKVVAIDSGNFLVPAGLARDIEVALANNTLTSRTAFVGASASFANVYSATDVENGIKNFAGETVVAGEPVVASFFEDYDSTKNLLNTVSKPIGIAPYDVWVNNGAGYGADFEAGNPANYTYANYNLQHGVSVLTRYFIEVPVVTSISQVKFPGLTVFEGNPTLSSLVTFNGRSNFVSVDPADLTSNPGKYFGEILGKILFIDTQYPKDFLEYVLTPMDNIENQAVTDIVPGSATSGLPHNLYYAGYTDPSQAKTVRINLVI